MGDEKREHAMSFKRRPTLLDPHVVGPCGTLPLGIYPSLVGYQALPLNPRPRLSFFSTVSSQSSNSLPPSPVEPDEHVPRGKRWCRHEGSREGLALFLNDDLYR